MVGSEKATIESEKITAQQIEHGEATTELNADELLLQKLGYKQVNKGTTQIKSKQIKLTVRRT